MLSTAAQHARRLRYLGPLRGRRPVAAYVGWLGYGNVGDEALFDAYRLAFPERPLVHVSHQRLLKLARRTGVRERARAVLLGGGTLIGHETYRWQLEHLLEGRVGVPAFMLGAGVLDPLFPERPEADARAELGRWRTLLERFDRVTVRGPRSVEVLAEVGVEAEAIGDPALLLSPPVAGGGFVERRLGLNLGTSRWAWGGDPQDAVEAAVEAAARLVSSGWEVELFPMVDSDLPFVDDAARRLGPAARVFGGWRDVGMLMAAMQRCHAFVGVKLHAVVLASAAGVPSLILEYHPKCRDFQASLGRERYSLRTEGIDADAVLALVEELGSDRAGQASAVADAVSDRRRALWSEVARIDGRLAIALDGAS